MGLTGKMSEKGAALSDPWVDDFLQYLESGRGYSKKTVRNYAHALRIFSAGSRRDWSALVADDFRRHLHALSVSRKQGTATVRLQFSALRSFYRYLQRRGRVKNNPILEIRLPSPARKLPRFFSEEQVTAFLEAPLEMCRQLDERNSSAARGPGRRMERWQLLRDAAILEVFYSTGMRIQELVGMNHDDVDSQHGVVRVMGKGGKERMAVLGRPALSAYVRYRSELAGLPWFRVAVAAFVGGGGKRLTARSIQQRFKVYLARAGLDPALSPHKLRHTFATHMLDHGADLRNVQELLGHAQLSTTQIYAQLTPERMRRSYDASHPMAHGS